MITFINNINDIQMGLKSFELICHEENILEKTAVMFAWWKTFS